MLRRKKCLSYLNGLYWTLIVVSVRKNNKRNIYFKKLIFLQTWQRQKRSVRWSSLQFRCKILVSIRRTRKPNWQKNRLSDIRKLIGEWRKYKFEKNKFKDNEDLSESDKTWIEKFGKCFFVYVTNESLIQKLFCLSLCLFDTSECVKLFWKYEHLTF